MPSSFYEQYLIFAHILASGHRELSSINISVQSHALERTHVISSGSITS